MRIVIFAALLALAACQKEPAPTTPAQVPPPTTASAPERHTGVQGWESDPTGYARLGSIAPDFKAKRQGGGEVTQDNLRDRWTILAFWGVWSEDSIANVKYIRALNSAADQDPDLDFLSVHVPPGPGRGSEAFGASPSLDVWFKENGGAWPTIIDEDGKIAEAFRIENPPLYLLVGPDLTIEAYRHDLSATPEDGIKPVMRGIAEIKKQIAAPE